MQVTPTLRLTRLRSRFTVRVSASHGFLGKLVFFQRYRAGVRRWATLKRVKLATVEAAGGGDDRHVGDLPRQRAPRLAAPGLFPQAQVGTCYLSAASNTLRVR